MRFHFTDVESGKASNVKLGETHEIPVTEFHMSAGERGMCEKCAFALALTAHFGEKIIVGVGVFWRASEPTKFFKQPSDMRTRRQDLDAGKEMKPFLLMITLVKL